MTKTETADQDIVIRLRAWADSFFPPTIEDVLEAADEIERLRKVNVMQARWLHEAQQEHKKFKDSVRQLLSAEGG